MYCVLAISVNGNTTWLVRMPQSLVARKEGALAVCQLSVLLGVDNVGIVESQLLQTQAD